MNVFMQRKNRLGHRFRFGFVRYSSLKVAAEAIKYLDGFRVGRASLSVALKKSPWKATTGGVSLSCLTSQKVVNIYARTWRDMLVGERKSSCPAVGEEVGMLLDSNFAMETFQGVRIPVDVLFI